MNQPHQSQVNIFYVKGQHTLLERMQITSYQKWIQASIKSVELKTRYGHIFSFYEIHTICSINSASLKENICILFWNHIKSFICIWSISHPQAAIVEKSLLTLLMSNNHFLPRAMKRRDAVWQCVSTLINNMGFCLSFNKQKSITSEHFPHGCSFCSVIQDFQTNQCLF